MNELLRRVAELVCEIDVKFTTCLLNGSSKDRHGYGTVSAVSVNAFVAIAHNIIDRGFDMMWVKNNIEPVTASQWPRRQFSCDYDIARDIAITSLRRVVCIYGTSSWTTGVAY
jgi:hypothetical protein